jgi:phosphatidylglycerophosphate synthase
VRLSRASVIASALYVIAGLAWAILAGGAGAWAGAWIVLVGVAGAFIPGIANQVSLARAYLAAPALYYALTPGHLGVLAVLVAVAGLTDLVDGTIARRFDKPSSLGGGLDPVVDGMFLGALTFGLAAGGGIPWWLAVVVVLRYLLPALAGGLLIVMGRPPELRHTLMGQVSTVLILFMIGGTVLLRGLGQDPGNFAVAARVVIPIATLATFIHLAWAVRYRRPVPSTERG